MTTQPRSRPSVRRSAGSSGCRALAVAGLTLALVAAASGAAATTASGTAFGQQVDLILEDLSSNYTPIGGGPEPWILGAGPPAFTVGDDLGSIRVDGPSGLGTLLEIGEATVAAASALPAIDDASAGALLDDVHLDLDGLLTLSAASIAAEARVLPDDEESCWSGAPGGADVSLLGATLSGSLVPEPIELPEAPEPGYVAFDLPGVATVILNEQWIEDGFAYVDAVRIDLHALEVPGIGTLYGTFYLAHAEAAVACGGTDLAVSLTAPEPSGGAIAVTATIDNVGEARAVDALFTLPATIALDPYSAAPSQGSCDIDEGAVACSLGNLGVGEAATVDLLLVPVHGGAVAIPVDVAAANPDPILANNHACELTETATGSSGSADLTAQLTAPASPVMVGSELTYTLTVRHEGGTEVAAALASLDLPFGTLLRSAIPTQGSCTGDRYLVCNLGSMTASDEVTVTVKVLVLIDGELMAVGVVSSALDDPDVTDNWDMTAVQAVPPGA